MEESFKEKKAERSSQSAALRSETQNSSIQDSDKKSAAKILTPELSEEGINIISSNPLALSPIKGDTQFDVASFTSQPDKPEPSRGLDSDFEDDSTEIENPQSIITQRTTPGLPSLMNESFTPGKNILATYAKTVHEQNDLEKYFALFQRLASCSL